MTCHLHSIYHFTTSTKENKVIPTEHIAKPAVTPKLGRFAMLRGLHRAPGSGAPARGLAAGPFVARSLMALCALAGIFALSSAAGAQAEPPKLIPYGSFATHQEGSVGVAVEGSGDLFVSSSEDGIFVSSTVVKLDPSGNLLSPPSPFGGEYTHYSGVAVNPTNGDLDVLGEEGLFFLSPPAQIFVYDPNTGAPVSSFEVPAPRNLRGENLFTDVQIAVDSAGDVYVPEPLKQKEKSPVGSGEYEYVPNDEVLEYSPSGTLLKTFTDSGELKEPTGVAVDSSGDVWIAGNNRIVELDSSGAPVEVNGKPVEIESEGVWSVALDGHSEVFAVVENSADPCGERNSPCVHLIEYSAEGRQLADVGAGSFGQIAYFAGGTAQRFHSMVAVNEVSGRVYVTDGNPSQNKVWVFGAPAAPVVGRELAAEVTTSEAKLGALVNPGGIQTTYRFEYGTTTAYGNTTPAPEGSVGEGITARAVWASANDLAPGSTYHYRVVASSELGTVYGPDQTFTALTAEEAACPNGQLRGGFSGRLPDCRAYELVTPPVKSSSQFDAGRTYASTASADGEALTLNIQEPRPGAPTAGEAYVARRSVSGWIAEDIMPLESYDGVGCAEEQAVYAYSEQLTKDVLEADGGSSTPGHNSGENAESCNPEGRQVVSGEPVGYANLLVRDNATGAYRLVNVTPPGVTPANAHFQDASADLSRVFFTETSSLAEGARYGVENLYEWDEGALRLVSVLPDGTAVPGSLAAKAGTPEYEGVVSSDGSHVLFTYGGALYDRVGGQRTVQIDEQQGGPGPGGGGSLMAATSDGSKVFFVDENDLTPGSTATAGEPDLYACVLPEGASKCELTDLTVAKAGEHADVLSVTPLGGHDSSYVYFVANGVLASNTREFTNSEGKTIVEGAEAGKENLYLWNGDKTTFIATGVVHNGTAGFDQASPDGEWLAFESKKSLTDYDVVQPTSGAGGLGVNELFLYSATTGQLACASCNPTGEPPIENGGVATPPELYRIFRARHLLTDAGKMFFETREALVPSDTNGQLDVYEYEGGGAHLISSGTSSFESNLESASESGNDVFFRSNQVLVPQDNQEGQLVIYDARVDGGISALASPPACTTTDACRTAVSPQPSIYGAPASQTFSGAGNLAPPPLTVVKKVTKKKTAKCKQGLVKNKKGKCVKRPMQKKKAMAKRATDDRGASDENHQVHKTSLSRRSLV